MKSGFLQIISTVFLVLLLASCSTPTINNSPSPIESSISSVPIVAETSILNILLEQARQSSSPQAEQYYLEAARYLIDEGKVQEASDILDSLNADSLTLALSTEILIEQARIAINANQLENAMTIMNSSRLSALPQLPDSLQASVRFMRSDIYERADNHLESAKQRIYADNLLPKSERTENHELIWNSLESLNVESLQALAENELNFEFQGWYELAIIGKAYQYNLDRQLVELEKWRQGRVRHPASLQLPLALRSIAIIALERPDNIALLLPMDINAGRVVRDGFMSAFFNVQEIGGKVPSILFYNTSTNIDVIALHKQARADGAEVIIGPLLKQNVARLQQEASLGVITLALNTSDNNQAGSQNGSNYLYQFTLSPEKEAQQIANKAWLDGHRFASILSPLNESTNDALARKRSSFIQTWLELGGQIVAEEKFNDEYTAPIESLLNLSDSEFRKESLAKLIRKSLEFTQRRRQDVDFIFLIAQAGEARQINPRLAYLYAGDIPVYASQDIFSGLPRPLEDIDLNGIVFSDSPWLLTINDDLKIQTQALFPQTSARNLRLQAFGIDAFRLYPRLKQLATSPDSQIYGATGLLTLDENNIISGELSWAKMEEGYAKLISPE